MTAARTEIRPRPEWRAFVAWRRAAGPFGRMVFAAPFFGRVEPGQPPGRSPRAEAAGLAVIPDPPAADEAYLIDLDPDLSLAAIPAFRRRSGRIVPLIARWPAEPAVLPVGPILRRLIAAAPDPVQRATAAGSPIFLLDGGRAGPWPAPGRRRLDRCFDNRYEYQIDYLPPVAGLREAGIDRIIWVSPAGAPAPDLVEYARRLTGAGLTIDYRRASTRS